MLVRKISVLVLFISVLGSCQQSKDWTAIPSIPKGYWGEYKRVDGYEDYRIKISGRGVFDITPVEFGDDLRRVEGIRFYTNNS